MFKTAHQYDSKILVACFLLSCDVGRVRGASPSFRQQLLQSDGRMRESAGTNKREASLVPMGKMKAKLADGRELEIDMPWYSYIGDMHVRFVFDTPTSMPNASADDLKRLGLTPDVALTLAVANIRRVYGAPNVTPWDDLVQVSGNSPDLDSSYFLDVEFWSQLLKQHPEGIVVAVIKRGGLLYSPRSNRNAVDKMRKSVALLHSSSDRLRISSGLYLFKDDKWSVLQDPVAQ